MSTHVRNCDCGSSDCDYRAVVDATPPDLDSAVDAGQTHSDEPTDAEEREGWLAKINDPHRSSDSYPFFDAIVVGRLIADVKRLEAEAGRLREILRLGRDIAEGYEWQECADAQQREFTIAAAAILEEPHD